MKVTDKYVLFWNGIYSNWYPCTFVYKGITFNCSEQAMMWEKAMTFGDEHHAKVILSTDDPQVQKKAGRLIENYDNEKWEEVRYQLVVDILVQKFEQNEVLLDELISTGNKILVEASPYDVIWGIGLGEQDPKALNESAWRGQNLLGKAVMDVRKLLK